MKRIVIALSLFLVPLSISAENKIKMVTYFPVPYVAYSKINAQKELDVGLTSSCEMNLGCTESGALGLRPLQASTVNLNRGRLDLNTAGAVKSTNVTLGSGSGAATLDFKTNVRIGTLNNGYSLESNDMTVDELKLFASHMRSGGEKFPSCAGTGASGAPQISWQKVKLKKAEEVYLVCGNPQETTCNPPSGEPTTQNCPSGYTGTQTRTWNYSTCSWNAWQGTCTQNYCCSYREEHFDEHSSERDWSSVSFNHQALMDHESCSNFNQTQGTNFNCGDNVNDVCYEGYDYDCPEFSGSQCPANLGEVHDFNVYWHYRRCVQNQRKPCSEVGGQSNWYPC